MVNNETSQVKTAHEIENHLWREMLLMGQQLMQLFFTTREEQEVQQKAYEIDGLGYDYVGQKDRRYVSLFGEVLSGEPATGAKVWVANFHWMKL
jgi:hypothetical protein